METSFALRTRTSIVRGLALLGTAWVALAASGCRQHAAAPSASDIAGTYALVSVDGAGLPASIRHDAARLEVRSGSFEIKPDGTCHCRTVFVPPSGKEITRDTHAQFTRQGTHLKMKWQHAGQTEGTVDADTFTMNNEGTVFVFRRP